MYTALYRIYYKLLHTALSFTSTVIKNTCESRENTRWMWKWTFKYATRSFNSHTRYNRTKIPADEGKRKNTPIAGSARHSQAFRIDFISLKSKNSAVGLETFPSLFSLSLLKQPPDYVKCCWQKAGFALICVMTEVRMMDAATFWWYNISGEQKIPGNSASQNQGICAFIF